jgi:outer membrane protein insertion porin family
MLQAAVLFLLAVGPVRAEGEKITDVSVQGNQRIESSVILNALSSKTGGNLAGDRIDADIKAIYRLGHFQDVSVESFPSAEGVTLLFTVKEKPMVRDIRFEGLKEFTEDKVREATDLKVNRVFSQKDLNQAVIRLKKFYSDEGYYLAEVTPVTEKKGDEGIAITFRVAEGEKVLIRSIIFEGNRAFSAKILMKQMETSEKWFLSWLTEAGTYKEDVLRNDVALLVDHYYNNGYINVKIGEPEVRLAPDRRGLVVTIGITEGEQYRVGSLSFKGDLLEPEEQVRRKLKLTSGQIFNRSLLRNDLLLLTDIFTDKGYAFANVNPATRVNQEQKKVDVTFELEKGEKVYIDRINVAGNTRTRDKVIRREMKLAEGDLYSSSALKRSKQSLMNLGFFEDAAISTAKGTEETKLDVNVEVKEKATGTFSVGAGYSSIDGLMGQLAVSQANFLGLGLRANLAASLGGETSTYSFGLTDPYFRDTRWTVGADIYRSEREYTDFSRRVTGGDIKAGYPLTDTLSTFWVYKYEDKYIYDMSPTLEVPPEETATTSSVTASLSRNTTDYRLDPSKGMTNNVSVEYAGLGGTSKFIRSHVDSAVFFPAFWSTVFSLRGQIGLIQENGEDIAIDEKYYLGGINTIRGYESRTVCPVDANGNYIGGVKMAVANVEYTFPLLQEVKMKGVIFFDAGNSYGTGQDMFSSFRTSYGAGIRWNSPLGPLRLEYGIPINPREGIDDKGGRFEFSIGGFF